MATIYGTAGDDTRVGTDHADVILLRGGDDHGAGRGGNDTILGSIGDDSLFGGTDRDSLFGGRGDDVLVGGAGDDRLSGRAGDDVLQGGAGRDFLLGGGGTNTLSGGSGIDRFRLSATDEVPLGLTFDEFEDRLSDVFTFEEFLIAAIADGQTDVLVGLDRGERIVVDAAFTVDDFGFTFIGGIDVDGDGDGDGFDILGVVTFRSGSGETALKTLLLPDQFRLVNVDFVGIDTGVRIDVTPF